MMIIDNSEYMRNGDYPPTRFEAQTDAINTVFQTKTDSNPENSVGIMTMAGKGWVAINLPIVSSLTEIKTGGTCYTYPRSRSNTLWRTHCVWKAGRPG